ncbi:MAG: hypothetical protein ABIN61_02325 [candidate division WOR-3 bacterium]
MGIISRGDKEYLKEVVSLNDNLSLISKSYEDLKEDVRNSYKFSFVSERVMYGTFLREDKRNF